MKPDKRLVGYIKKALLKGHSVSSIKEYLLLHHHEEKEVNRALSAVSRDYSEDKIRP
ncbi:MAG: hypothetical protein ACQEP1_05420 [Nanobdellota archaeon]